MEISVTPRKTEGSGKHCVVKSCSNNSKKITKWTKSACDIHQPLLHSDCPCMQPYQMHRFPSGSDEKSEAIHMQWVKNINLKDFCPKKYSTVCSVHFIDGKPTTSHPYPTLSMGYESPKQLSKGRKPPTKRVAPATPETPKRPKTNAYDYEETDVDESKSESSMQTEGVETANKAIQWYDVSIVDHTYAHPDFVVKRQSKATQTETQPEVTATDLNAANLKFYTGLDELMFWNLVASLMAAIPKPKFQLAVPEQLLLFLMRLRLGLMFTDLGVRFKVSRTTACDIFSFWLPRIAEFMRDNIIFWPSRDTLHRTRPSSFDENYPNATCIIDCTEVFVQRPKDLKKRAQTYSNYKSHNTYKALYCIAPHGLVTYVSKLFGGRASDTFISKNSGFADHLQPGDEILADRGFTIEDILAQGVKLTIPAVTKGHKDRRLPEEDVTTTRRIANVRIHVERAIRRLKCFKILANIIPGRVKNVDDILVVCAGLCNLQPLLINEEVEDEDDNIESGDGDDMESGDDEDFDEGSQDMSTEYMFDVDETVE